MNQTQNLVQWKNLTNTQKFHFNFKDFKYQKQNGLEFKDLKGDEYPLGCDVYRLVIEEDKWYCCFAHRWSIQKGSTLIGSSQHPSVLSILRPARPDELPSEGVTKPVPQGDELVGYWCSVSDYSIESTKKYEVLALITKFYGGSYFDTSGDDWLYAYPVNLNKIKEKGKLWEGAE